MCSQGVLTVRVVGWGEPSVRVTYRGVVVVVRVVGRGEPSVRVTYRGVLTVCVVGRGVVIVCV